MKWLKISGGAVLVLVMCLMIPTRPVMAAEFAASLSGGANGGGGFHLSGAALDFTRDVPLSARFSMGYFSSSAGDPYAARHVFINDNTNGSPEDDAHQWQFRFDLMFPAFQFGPQQIYIFGGPRYARYTANFNYVGGNEHFDVVANPWGFGAGLETRFAIGARTSLLLQLGLDRYQDTALTGHDTTYTPEGDHINDRDGYDYGSADEAVDQPDLEVMAMLGLMVGF